MINQACLKLYGVDAMTAIPRLMAELETPHRVAGRLDVTTNAVRNWLLARNWLFDHDAHQWVAPEAEVEHAPSV